MSKRTMIIIIITMVVVVALLTGIFVAVAVFSNKADEANAQKAKIYYEQIESNYQNQKYKDSLKALEDLTSKFPNSPYIEEANKKFPDLTELVEKQKDREKEEHDKRNKEYQAKYDELFTSYHKVLSANIYKDMYIGVGIKNNVVIITVNDYWKFASKDVKIAYVETCVKTWAMMHGAREMDFKYETWKFEFRHELSERKLATWDSAWGTSIKN